MSVVFALLRRDLALAVGGGRRGGAVLPVRFFLSVAMLFPFAVGPAPELLARTGGGVIWVAAMPRKWSWSSRYACSPTG